MAKARTFSELRNRLPAESLARVEARVKLTLHDMALDELRTARELTQERLAETLGIKQATVSKIERQSGMYVSTLTRFIEAMGGTLEIRACFPEGSVRIKQFSEARSPGAGPSGRQPHRSRAGHGNRRRQVALEPGPLSSSVMVYLRTFFGGGESTSSFLCATISTTLALFARRRRPYANRGRQSGPAIRASYFATPSAALTLPT